MHVSMYVYMYVCLSVTGLRLKYTGLRIVYVRTSLARTARDSIAMEVEVEYSDRRRRQNESRCMEDG